jgi:hypothetical protein
VVRSGVTPKAFKKTKNGFQKSYHRRFLQLKEHSAICEPNLSFTEGLKHATTIAFPNTDMAQ